MSAMERKTEPDVVTALLSGIRALILESRRTVARGVNAALVWTNLEIGRRIVEHEQGGKERAGYAEGLLKLLSGRLCAEFGKGYSVTNLQQMRQFFLVYGKQQTVSDKSVGAGARSLSAKSETPSRISPTVLPLSWSHYVFLMGVSDENERRFYEIESAKQNWSLRELRRQFDSSLYERLALSRDEGKTADLSRRGQQDRSH